MRVVLQRVSSASVTIDGRVTGQIGPGLLVLVGIAATDTPDDGVWLAQKIAALRIFADADGQMNLSLAQPSPRTLQLPGLLVISQFTLLASTRKGNRPSFNAAARPELARPLYEQFLAQLTATLGRPLATGEFGANMQISLVNDGPVTLVLDSQLRE